MKNVFKELELQVSSCDTDITIKLPNKHEVVLQWRVEGPSLDVLLDNAVPLYCFNNRRRDSMSPALAGEFQHVRIADQVVIPYDK